VQVLIDVGLIVAIANFIVLVFFFTSYIHVLLLNIYDMLHSTNSMLYFAMYFPYAFIIMFSGGRWKTFLTIADAPRGSWKSIGFVIRADRDCNNLEARDYTINVIDGR
jgi:hypothetical protein